MRGIARGIAGVLCLAAAASLGAASEDEEERQIDEARAGIDAEDAGEAQDGRAESLAKQFGVEQKVVDGLRDEKKGWGEITIALATAQELNQRDPKTYPTMTESLAKVRQMRADGMGWGKIARELGFKLGPVVSAAQRARKDFRTLPARSDKPDRPDGASRPRPDRPERPVKPDRPPRQDHPRGK